MQQTRITQKGQTTIPKKVRSFLDVSPGNEIEWHVIRGIVVVDAARKVQQPAAFLCNQTTLNLDMVKLVKEIREER